MTRLSAVQLLSYLVQKSDTLPFTLTGLKWGIWLYLLEWHIQPPQLLCGTCYALCFYHPSFPFYLLLAKIQILGRVRVTSLQSNVLRTTGLKAHVMHLFPRWVLFRGNGTVIWISCQPLKHNSVWCASCPTKQRDCPVFMFLYKRYLKPHIVLLNSKFSDKTSRRWGSSENDLRLSRLKWIEAAPAEKCVTALRTLVEELTPTECSMQVRFYYCSQSTLPLEGNDWKPHHFCVQKHALTVQIEPAQISSIISLLLNGYSSINVHWGHKRL